MFCVGAHICRRSDCWFSANLPVLRFKAARGFSEGGSTFQRSAVWSWNHADSRYGIQIPGDEDGRGDSTADRAGGGEQLGEVELDAAVAADEADPGKRV